MTIRHKKDSFTSVERWEGVPVYCPKCGGLSANAAVNADRGRSEDRGECDLCNGTGQIKSIEARAWRAAHPQWNCLAYLGQGGAARERRGTLKKDLGGNAP